MVSINVVSSDIQGSHKLNSRLLSVTILQIPGVKMAVQYMMHVVEGVPAKMAN